jgi:hypothetical protein
MKNDPFDMIVRTTTARAADRKKRRGRPSTDGKGVNPGVVRHPVVLLRALEMLKKFEQARRAGLGHTEALAATVEAVKRRWPWMKGVNRSEVERVLREFQPKERPQVWCVRDQGSEIEVYIGPRWRP